jgi:hypothetical protein
MLERTFLCSCGSKAPLLIKYRPVPLSLGPGRRFGTLQSPTELSVETQDTSHPKKLNAVEVCSLETGSMHSRLMMLGTMKGHDAIHQAKWHQEWIERLEREIFGQPASRNITEAAEGELKPQHQQHQTQTQQRRHQHVQRSKHLSLTNSDHASRTSLYPPCEHQEIPRTKGESFLQKKDADCGVHGVDFDGRKKRKNVKSIKSISSDKSSHHDQSAASQQKPQQQQSKERDSGTAKVQQDSGLTTPEVEGGAILHTTLRKKHQGAESRQQKLSVLSKILGIPYVRAVQLASHDPLLLEMTEVDLSWQVRRGWA